MAVFKLRLSSVGNPVPSVDRLELFKGNDVTSFAHATVGGCGSDVVPLAPAQTFCATMLSNQLVIPANTTIDVSVRARLKSDVDGAVTNENIQLMIPQNPVINATTGEGAVHAQTVTTAMVLSGNDGDAVQEREVFIGTSTAGPNADIKSTTHRSVLAKIVAIANANPDANGSNIPTGVADVGQFGITAAPNSNAKNGLNKVVFDKLLFTLSAVNVQFNADSVKFFNKADGSWSNACSVVDLSGVVQHGSIVPSGAVYLSCIGLSSSGVNTVVDPGSTQTFVVQMNVINPKVNSAMNSVLQVSLSSFDSMALGTYGYSASHVEWIDRDTSGTSFFWIEFPDTVVKSTAYQS